MDSTNSIAACFLITAIALGQAFCSKQETSPTKEDSGSSSSAPVRGQETTSYRVAATLEETYFVSCFDEDFKLIGAQFVRSPLLESPNGAFRAYVQAQAIPGKLTRENHKGPECRNTTTVFLTEGDNTAPRILHFLSPMLYQLGNGVELNEWSPDGRYLLMSEMRWTYASDWFAFTVYLYDTQDEVLIPVESDLLFDRHFGRDTNIGIRAVGFHSDGASVVVQAQDQDGPEMGEPELLLTQPNRWVIRWQENKIESLPADYKPTKSGRILR